VSLSSVVAYNDRIKTVSSVQFLTSINHRRLMWDVKYIASILKKTPMKYKKVHNLLQRDTANKKQEKHLQLVAKIFLSSFQLLSIFSLIRDTVPAKTRKNVIFNTEI
uniref:Uncharacterized protein n=1 Tax=Cyanoderma ruficeps TaxID=181631 RepID=A0A8C3R0X1_9PASS